MIPLFDNAQTVLQSGVAFSMGSGFQIMMVAFMEDTWHISFASWARNYGLFAFPVPGRASIIQFCQVVLLYYFW